ncbi:MAG TPA: SRPBCC family protein [Limnobacter sp.]|uniref:SRPBCC family protein n=1 Tax=Limnobacter sp. TaxID=2003368 RepID=UPI002EDA0C36
MTQAPLTIQRTCHVPVPVADCFAIFTRLGAQEYIHHDAVIAPIVQVDRAPGQSFTEIGDVQHITFKGGYTIREELLAFVPNRQFVYKGTGFSQPMLNWLDHAKGSFEFEKNGDGTDITWRYNFYLREGLGATVKRGVFNTLIVNVIWNRMMTKTLSNLTQIITLRAMQPGRTA